MGEIERVFKMTQDVELIGSTRKALKKGEQYSTEQLKKININPIDIKNKCIEIKMMLQEIADDLIEEITE